MYSLSHDFIYPLIFLEIMLTIKIGVLEKTDKVIFESDIFNLFFFSKMITVISRKILGAYEIMRNTVICKIT